MLGNLIWECVCGLFGVAVFVDLCHWVWDKGMRGSLCQCSELYLQLGYLVLLKKPFLFIRCQFSVYFVSLPRVWCDTGLGDKRAFKVVVGTMTAAINNHSKLVFLAMILSQTFNDCLNSSSVRYSASLPAMVTLGLIVDSIMVFSYVKHYLSLWANSRSFPLMLLWNTDNKSWY